MLQTLTVVTMMVVALCKRLVLTSMKVIKLSERSLGRFGYWRFWGKNYKNTSALRGRCAIQLPGNMGPFLRIPMSLSFALAAMAFEFMAMLAWEEQVENS